MYQVLTYDMQFYQQPIPVNYPAVVLSTSRSLMKDALFITIPLQPTITAMPDAASVRAAADAANAAGLLAPVRSFLAAAARLQYGLEEHMSAHLQSEFLRSRKQDSSFGAEHFHAQLTVRTSTCQRTVLPRES